MARGIVEVKICFWWLKSKIPHIRSFPPLPFSVKHKACHTLTQKTFRLTKHVLRKFCSSVSNETIPVLIKRVLGNNLRNIRTRFLPVRPRPLTRRRRRKNTESKKQYSITCEKIQLNYISNFVILRLQNQHWTSEFTYGLHIVYVFWVPVKRTRLTISVA